MGCQGSSASGHVACTAGQTRAPLEAPVWQKGGVVGFMDLNPVQILRDNMVAALVTRIAMENEPYFDDYLEIDMPEAMREAGLEVVEESWPAKATWKTAEDASLRPGDYSLCESGGRGPGLLELWMRMLPRGATSRKVGRGARLASAASAAAAAAADASGQNGSDTRRRILRAGASDQYSLSGSFAGLAGVGVWEESGGGAARTAYQSTARRRVCAAASSLGSFATCSSAAVGHVAPTEPDERQLLCNLLAWGREARPRTRRAAPTAARGLGQGTRTRWQAATCSCTAPSASRPSIPAGWARPWGARARLRGGPHRRAAQPAVPARPGRGRARGGLARGAARALEQLPRLGRRQPRRGDCQELDVLLRFLADRRGVRQVAILGSSTGCQDAVRYLARGAEARRVVALVLQAPVSDREARLVDSTPEKEQAVQRCRAQAAALIAAGRGQEAMPREANPLLGPPDHPVSAYRFDSLTGRLTDDDMFSSDLTEEELVGKLGHVAVPTLLVGSADDEYVPSWVDMPGLLGRLSSAMASGQAGENEVVIIKEGGHGLSSGDAPGQLSAAVARFLARLPPPPPPLSWEPRAAEEIRARLVSRGAGEPGRPLLVALAGPPGSGKSTAAAALGELLGEACVVLGMDGFHSPLAALRARPDAEEAVYRRRAVDGTPLRTPCRAHGAPVRGHRAPEAHQGVQKVITLDVDFPNPPHVNVCPLVNADAKDGNSNFTMLELPATNARDYKFKQHGHDAHDGQDPTPQHRSTKPLTFMGWDPFPPKGEPGRLDHISDTCRHIQAHDETEFGRYVHDQLLHHELTAINAHTDVGYTRLRALLHAPDHIPMLTQIKISFRSDCPTQSPIKWDHGIMAARLQTGEMREEFIHDVAHHINHHRELFRVVKMDQFTTRHNALLNHIISAPPRSPPTPREGGLTATSAHVSLYLDDPKSIERLLARSDDQLAPVGEITGPPPPSIEDITAAAEELEHIQKRLWQARRRRYNPPWGWPLEVTILPLHPQYITRPGAQRIGI
ncbi:unnamed protein product [Prorocentrum cordatum]|uniref:Uncharacterized protein n=1 Tax=Prorocentrum cordatum TaxID=2364126 RepID=A0ABN9V743_9DINO|nr:unnamed protein product [Polarella glacialis]